MLRRREAAVNLSNLNAEPHRFLMADKSVPRALAIWPRPVGNEIERDERARTEGEKGDFRITHSKCIASQADRKTTQGDGGEMKRNC